MSRHPIHIPSLFVMMVLMALPINTVNAKMAKANHTIIGVADARPDTYPLGTSFAERRQLIIDGLASEDLSKWRRGYFSGGDPGKYLPTAAMAHLIKDPNDKQAIALMNDKRSGKEMYHFAALNWGRFLPLFSESLTPETHALVSNSAKRYTSFLSGGGTENHKVMWKANSLVMADYLQGDNPMLALKAKPVFLKEQKAWLKSYVKNLYHYGMGEWESATYHMFCAHSLINIYDFSKDPECRLLAAAGLEYMIGAYALKYTDGILSGPSQRGFASTPAGKITDQSGWLWWGSTADINQDQARGFRYAMHPATSSWRPNALLTAIATRDLPKLPFAVRGSKANYWFGQRIAPKANQTQESLWVSQHYTLGSLWHGWDRHGQTTRWQFTAAGVDKNNTAKTLTGGHFYQGRRKDGLGRYDQTLQHKGTLVLLSQVPSTDTDESHTLFISLPADTMPIKQRDWWIAPINKSTLAIRAIGGEAQLGSLPATAKEIKRAKKKQVAPPNHLALIIKSTQGGFLIHTSDEAQEPSAKFINKVINSEVNTSTDGETLHVACTIPNGESVTATYNTQGNKILGTINKTPVTFDNWPVFESPYFTQKDGAITVNDGQNSYSVDFTGVLPVYRQ